MAKSTINLPDGTTVTIDGSPEEIKKILSVYQTEKVKSTAKERKSVAGEKNEKRSEQDNILEVIKYIKNCEEADAIEEKILDRASQVDRVLLPLYVADKLESKPPLSSGDIHSVLKELGIKIALPNISNTLRGTASKYVMGDRQLKKGAGVVKYKISRPGRQYITKILEDGQS